jgi:hypothetical protein
VALTTGPEHPNSLNMQWRREYRAKRHMEPLRVDELNRRASDLITNLFTLTPAGQLGCQEIDVDGPQWRQSGRMYAMSSKPGFGQR